MPFSLRVLLSGKSRVAVPLVGLVTLSLTAYTVGCGSSSNTVAPVKAVKVVTRDVDPDPNFATGPGAIAGQYLVSLSDNSALSGSQKQATTNMMAPPDTTPADLCNQYGGQVADTYSNVGAFSARMNETQARQMSHDARVTFVESNVEHSGGGDQYVGNISSGQGLDRIDQHNLPLDGHFRYQSDGTGVNVYVLDTGIWPQHPEFGGRVSLDYSAVGGTADDNSNDTYGTGVASIIGGSTTGVAKNVRLHSIKVLRANNIGTTEEIVNGLNWVIGHVQKPAVVNMSIETGNLSLWNFLISHNSERKAVEKLVNSGIPVVVCAGNNNISANNNVMPAGIEAATTVGAMTSFEARRPDSNYGSVIDTFAPGDAVAGASFSVGANGRVPTFSKYVKSSFSAALDTGVVAQYLQTHPGAGRADIENWMNSTATNGRLSDIPSGTPNRIVFTNQ